MLWSVVLPMLVYVIAVVVLFTRTRAAERTVVSLTRAHEQVVAEREGWKARAHEYNALWLEERALTRELMTQRRTPGMGRHADTEPDEDPHEPMTVSQADRLVVDAERRQREREAAERVRRASGEASDDDEAPDLTGLEPVPIMDDDAMPVHRLTESVYDDDDDDDDD